MNNLMKWTPLFFVIARFVLFLSLPLDAIRGYGDYWNFYSLAELGWPFFDLWVEFPPVFPFLSALLFRLTGERQHAYEYLLALTLSFFQAGNIHLFLRLAKKHFGIEVARRRIWVYFALLVGLFYGWGYFDPVAVFAMLLGLDLLVREKDFLAGGAFAFGALTKWFPLLGLVLLWRRRSSKRATQVTALVLGIIVAVYGVLMLLSPEMTIASLRAQVGRGSWETVWALIDGNLSTGNLGSAVDRLDPSTANLSARNPALISPWLTLIPFAVLGGWLYWMAPRKNHISMISFFGLTLSVFFLWSPGWSPQWVLYLLPLILLALPEREAILMALVWVMMSLLEWPILLSRGYFQTLWVIIPIRTLLLILLVIVFWQVVTETASTHSVQGKSSDAIP
jgi:hypothetical protein